MRIEIKDDFDLDKIAESGQCFRWERTGTEEYRIPLREKCLCIKHTGGNFYELDCTQEEYDRIWRGYFDLEENYASIRNRIDPEKDPYLFKASVKGKGIRILRQDLWETLVSFIISQNRNIPAIRRSIGLLCLAAGERMTDSAGREYAVFPGPAETAQLSEKELIDCRLGYRGEYVRAAAEHVLRQENTTNMLENASDDEALARLMEIRGVGIKVASCVALFALHRMNCFPIDTRIRKVLAEEYPKGFPMEEYSPWCGVYQQYMYAGKTG